MTIERAFIVAVEPTDELLGIVDDLRSAAVRAEKADPGDRSDVVRFEALAARLEHAAAYSDGMRHEVPVEDAAGVMPLGMDLARWPASVPDSVAGPARSAIEQGSLPVLLVTPLEPGQRGADRMPVPAAPPAERWQSNGSFGREAVAHRFRAQIESALSEARDGQRTPAIAPSGVQNAVVTELLREYAAAVPGTSRVDAPVEYRDGSRAENMFPLRALTLQDRLGPADMELHLALLSIRHTEMDTVVHGAWLRNVEVSRPRPASQTDDFVYGVSMTQLAELTRHGTRSVQIHIYQTGLETAIIGFYRAVVDHLLAYPGSVAVQPMYFKAGSGGPRKGGETRRRTGTNQAQKLNRRKQTVVAQRAPFGRGTPWQM